MLLLLQYILLLLLLLLNIYECSLAVGAAAGISGTVAV